MFIEQRSIILFETFSTLQEKILHETDYFAKKSQKIFLSLDFMKFQ